MKNLTQYIHKTELAFFTYLKRGDLDRLIKDLKVIERHADEKIGGKDCGLWFKFYKNYTLATTIHDIERDLNDNHNGNKQFMTECLQIACSLEGDLQVFYS